MIIIDKLSKYYGKKMALDNISLSFQNSQVIAIMGENGAGKSTLLKICAGILPYSSGQINIDGFSIKNDSIKARELIGYLPEMPELYERLTGREFLFYIASLRKIENAEDKINRLSDLVGIFSSLDYELGSYSKGMKQKISLISAIVHEPNNLLLDEPVYGLDPLTSRTIQDFIKKRKGTTVIATHSTQLVQQTTDFVYFLMNGRIVASDYVRNLVNKFGDIEKSYFYFKDGE